jgi:dCTP diphosphatase
MTHGNIPSLTTRIRAFAQARDWGQFHTPKNLAMALSVEVAELTEHFQWLTTDEARALKDNPEAKAELESEVADIAIYLLRLADVLEIDVASAIRAKMEKNEKRFPVHRARGRSDGGKD